MNKHDTTEIKNSPKNKGHNKNENILNNKNNKKKEFKVLLN